MHNGGVALQNGGYHRGYSPVVRTLTSIEYIALRELIVPHHPSAYQPKAFPFQTLPYRRRSVSGALFEAVLLVMGAWLVVAVCTTAVGGGLLEPWLGGWLPVMVVAVALLVSWVLVYRAPAGGTSA